MPTDSVAIAAEAETLKSLVYTRVEVTDRVCVVTLDHPREKLNILNSALIPEFERILEFVATCGDVIACVLISGKSENFIAGADINELRTAADRSAVLTISQRGQAIFDRLEQLNKPVVAAIDGACLGGGLELALAAHYRLATDHPKTVLGLPEVQLGLLPGSGGTWRLPRLVGYQAALSLMLTGSPARPAKCLAIGLVDSLISPAGLRTQAIRVAQNLATGALKMPPRGSRVRGAKKLLETTSLGRKVMFRKAREGVLTKTHGLYPAPQEILNVVEASCNGANRSEALRLEREAFATLSQTPQARALMHLYFAQTGCRKNPYPGKASQVHQIGVLGAGLMGAGISCISLSKGYAVRLKDLTPQQLAQGKHYVWKVLEKRVRRGGLSAFDASSLMDKLQAQCHYRQFDQVNLVIEAVFERLELKTQMIAELEAVVSDQAVIASNTSALPIGDIAAGSRHPERIIGMHYFSPVEKMPLLEIVRTEKNPEEVIATAYDVGLRQGKTVIVVGDGPGFYTTRILAPFMDEAAHLVLEGMAITALDEAMQQFGFPVGPITLVDEVGVDVALHIADYLGKSFGVRAHSVDRALLAGLVDAQALGRKSGAGFYLYPPQPKRRRNLNPRALALIARLRGPGQLRAASSLQDVQKRIAYRMINEACYALQEGIIGSPRDGDVGAVFGLGFPPFLGGPFHYVDRFGAAAVVADLDRFAQTHGERFAPAEVLRQAATTGTRFYDS